MHVTYVFIHSFQQDIYRASRHHWTQWSPSVYTPSSQKTPPPKKAEINGASSTCKRVLFNFIISFFIIHEIAGTGSHPTQRFVLGLPRALGLSQDTLSMKLFFALPLFGNSMICLFHPRLHLEDNNEYVI